jgi:hypothetical protein
MSENPVHGHDGSEAGHGAPAHHFQREDLEHFDSEDTTAGSAIGKMLAVIFLYTIFAMSLAAWWTYGRNFAE